MQLDPGEKVAFAYFSNSNNAEKAIDKLLQMGYENVQLDRVSEYGESNDAVYNNPIMGRSTTNTGLSLFSAGTDKSPEKNARVLLGADPSVSGMSTPGLAGGENYLVTVVSGEKSFDYAKKILMENGGNLGGR